MAEGTEGSSLERTAVRTHTEDTDCMWYDLPDHFVDHERRMVVENDLPWYTEDNVPVDTVYVSYNVCELQEHNLRSAFSSFGPVRSISMHTPFRNTGKPFYYAFVTFESVESAAKCLYARRTLSNKFYIKPADTWHQRSYREGMTKGSKKKSLDEEDCSSSDSSSGPEPMNLLQLNDDCLLLIMSQLSIMDLISAKKACSRLEAICTLLLKRFTTYEFLERKRHYTLLEVRTIISEIGPYLTKLSVSHNIMPRQAKRFLNFIPKHCSKLKELQLLDFVLNDTVFMQFGKLVESLVSLTLSRCVLDDNVGKLLGHAKCLERLDLSFSSKLTGTCLRYVRNIKYMNLDTCLNLQGQPFALFIVQNPTLEYLNINGCQRLSSKPFHKIHKTLIELKHLVCNSHYETVNAASLGNIAKLPKLKNLEIKYNMPGKITKILESFEECNQLEQLDLAGTLDSQLSYSLLQRLKNLRTLNVNYNLRFTGDDLETIANSGKFVELHIAGCNEIQQSTILEFIRANRELRVLDLSCQLVNESLLFSTIDILKEQAVGSSNQRQLKLILGTTSICPVILENALIKSNRHLMQLNFATTPNLSAAPDYDSDNDSFDDLGIYDYEIYDIPYDGLPDFNDLDYGGWQFLRDMDVLDDFLNHPFI